MKSQEITFQNTPEQFKMSASLLSTLLEKAFIDQLMGDFPESIYLKDRQCRLVRANRKLLESLGLERMEQVVGKTDVDLFGEAFGRMTIAVDQDIINTGKARIGLIESRPLDNGDLNWTLTTKIPLTDPEGNIIGLAGITREINEIKKTEEALRIKQNQLSIAGQIAGLGYWEYDVILDLFTFNDNFYRVFHTTVEEVGTYTMSAAAYTNRFLPSEDRNLVAVEIKKALATTDPAYNGKLEHRIVYPNGEIGFITVQFFVVKDEHGRTVKTFGANQNITERKRNELELLQYRNQLEQLVEERTLQLEAANKDLEAFAYSVSHDLRAPIRHINGFAQMLHRTLEPATGNTLEYIELILKATRQMGSMIDVLLEFSKLGRQPIQKTDVDLNELVAGVIRDLEEDLVHRKIRWLVQDLPTISGDPGLLGIAFENLLSNAVKYTRNRERAVIEIGARQENAPKHTIFIKDNGVGFNMAYADKLFKVFQRLHLDTDFEGTGIGLATVQRIIEKHGGSVRATAEEGLGATFYLTI